jgi:hypothetical protein
VRKAPAGATPTKASPPDASPAGAESTGELLLTTTTTTTDGPVSPGSMPPPSPGGRLFDAEEDANATPLALEPKVGGACVYKLNPVATMWSLRKRLELEKAWSYCRKLEKAHGFNP